MATTFTAKANLHSDYLSGDVSTKTDAHSKGEILLNRYSSTAVVSVNFTLKVSNKTTATQNASLRVYIGNVLVWSTSISLNARQEVSRGGSFTVTGPSNYRISYYGGDSNYSVSGTINSGYIQITCPWPSAGDPLSYSTFSTLGCSITNGGNPVSTNMRADWNGNVAASVGPKGGAGAICYISNFDALKNAIAGL